MSRPGVIPWESDSSDKQAERRGGCGLASENFSDKLLSSPSRTRKKSGEGALGALQCSPEADGDEDKREN